MSSNQPDPTPYPSMRHFSSSFYVSCYGHIYFHSGYNTSKLYADAPDNILKILTSENVTVNFHRFCITEAVSGIIS
jgi:hypothetical protein